MNLFKALKTLINKVITYEYYILTFTKNIYLNFYKNLIFISLYLTINLLLDIIIKKNYYLFKIYFY